MRITNNWKGDDSGLEKTSDTEARLIRVEEIIQRFGFRRFVEDLAHKSKISGYVENLKDSSVRIFAQDSRPPLLREK